MAISPKDVNGIVELRQLWQHAHADKSPGLAANKILDQLERKYQALADAAGKTN